LGEAHREIEWYGKPVAAHVFYFVVREEHVALPLPVCPPHFVSGLHDALPFIILQ